MPLSVLAGEAGEVCDRVMGYAVRDGRTMNAEPEPVVDGWCEPSALTGYELVGCAAQRRWVNVYRLEQTVTTLATLVAWDRTGNRCRVRYQSGGMATIRQSQVAHIYLGDGEL